jgi:hypothetical protein
MPQGVAMSDDFEMDDVWKDYNKACADALMLSDNARPTASAITLLAGIENVLHERHGTPPGMIACAFCIPNTDENKSLVNRICDADPKLSIDDAAIWMGVSKKTIEETEVTLNVAWDLFALSANMYVNVLSDHGTEKAKSHLHATLVCFAACVFLRNWAYQDFARERGHSEPDSMPTRNPVEPINAFEMMTGDPNLAVILSKSKGLRRFDQHNRSVDPDPNIDLDDC